METDEIVNRLNAIFRDVLNNNAIVITDRTTSNDIPEWDSLAFIELIVAIEKYFKIEFTSFEIQDWRNVGEMSESIKKKLN